MTRRTLVGSLVATAAAFNAKSATQKEWKPRLGILGTYTPANVQFAKAQGYTNMILGSGPGSTLDATTITDAQIDAVRKTLDDVADARLGAAGDAESHFAGPREARAKRTHYFIKAIELAGKLGIPYMGAMSGKNAALPFPKQIDEIVRVYNEKYFPVCEKYKVRICWEPWPEGPNLATCAVGYEALFKGFNNSPYVGLQFDPSHFVRQFMNPDPDGPRLLKLHLRRPSQGHGDPAGGACSRAASIRRTVSNGGATASPAWDPFAGTSSSACCRPWVTPAA